MGCYRALCYKTLSPSILKHKLAPVLSYHPPTGCDDSILGKLYKHYILCIMDAQSLEGYVRIYLYLAPSLVKITHAAVRPGFM